MVFNALAYSACRWVQAADEAKLEEFTRAQASAICLDRYDRPTLLVDDLWRLKYLKERYPAVEFVDIAES